MITYGIKRSPTGHLWMKRWIMMRRSNKDARRGKKLRTYRRLWWWDEIRWNQRHGIN